MTIGIYLLDENWDDTVSPWLDETFGQASGWVGETWNEYWPPIEEFFTIAVNFILGVLDGSILDKNPDEWFVLPEEGGDLSSSLKSLGLDF